MLVSAGVAYAESYEGTRGTNRYAGTPNSDRGELYAGNDTAVGLAGSDKLFGGPDNDKLYGEDGNVTLLGQAGSDVLAGGPGEDHLFGASGNETIYTGTLEQSDRDSDEISCGDGSEDTVYSSGPEHSGHNNIDSSCENVISYQPASLNLSREARAGIWPGPRASLDKG
jgi:Ca2+-binding RTX toxin-like protein